MEYRDARSIFYNFIDQHATPDELDILQGKSIDTDLKKIAKIHNKLSSRYNLTSEESECMLANYRHHHSMLGFCGGWDFTVYKRQSLDIDDF